MSKISFIFGTRPEAIKMAPVINVFKKSGLNVEVCFTGQHREMVEQILPVFNIVPDVDLNLMTHGQSLSGFTGRALQTISSYIESNKPDHVFVQGDTATVFAGALAAFYNQKKVYHIEAGLRTFDKWSPFPEEINRVLTGRIADCHFPPTERAMENLKNEGIQSSRMVVTGNTGIDALLTVHNLLKEELLKPTIEIKIKNIIEEYEDRMVLITAHRRESFGVGFDNICRSIKKLAKKFSDYAFLYPVHLNPNVQKPVNKHLKGIDNIFLCNPLDYLNFVYVMGKSKLILTDSGGIQEEAPSLNKPLVVMRDTTERPEGVNVGCAKLVGTDVDQIVNTVSDLIINKDGIFDKMSIIDNPYGDGNASKRILEFFLNNNEK